MVELRVARDTDVPTLVELARAFYDEDGFTTSTADLRTNFGVLLGSAEAHIVLATTDGRDACGFALTTTAFVLESGVVAELQDLYVTPAARGLGVGSALIEDSERWARTKSASQLEVVVAPNGRDVTHLIDFYRARSFVDDGRRLLGRGIAVGEPAPGKQNTLRDSEGGAM